MPNFVVSCPPVSCGRNGLAALKFCPTAASYRATTAFSRPDPSGKVAPTRTVRVSGSPVTLLLPTENDPMGRTKPKSYASPKFQYLLRVGVFSCLEWL